MPELKGFEQQADGSTLALIHFPQARAHMKQPDGSFIALANPHTQKMDQAMVDLAITSLESRREDPSFYEGVKARMEAFSQNNRQRPSATEDPMRPSTSGPGQNFKPS